MSGVTLERAGPEHADTIQRLVTSDPAIVANTRMPEPYPHDGARTFLEQAVGRHEAGVELTFVVRDVGGTIVGMCGLIPAEGDGGESAEIGYWIGASYQGRGLATTAARELVKLAFDSLGILRVHACTREANPASRRVLEKAGLELVGVRPNRGEVQKWADDEPLAFYELTRDE